MSFLSDFEGRISSVFGAAPQGYTEPFSFKKLAKRAAREMENETYEIGGVDTAPALYTVLVSSIDDAIMRPLYGQITDELRSFVEERAQKRGYTFVGEPVVRFMVDPELKSGKFAVFADNVDARDLMRLREEERAFLGGGIGVGGAAAMRQHAIPGRPQSRSSMPQPTPVALGGTPDGLDVMPQDFDGGLGFPVASASESTPMPVSAMSAPLVSAAAQPGAVPVPQTQRRNIPSFDNVPEPAAPSNVPLVAAQPFGTEPAAHNASCMLIERSTGRTFSCTAPVALIGREQSTCQVVLRDPNVSRRHAELSFDGRDWHIADLNSTNGTMVNDIDVNECTLRDGDLVTVGLVNLEFREMR